MSGQGATADDAARQLAGWFYEIYRHCDASLFAVATSEPHRHAAAVGVLCRYARQLVASRVDREGDLYAPVCFMLAAACRVLSHRLDAQHWKAALQNAVELAGRIERVGPEMRASGLPLGTPVTIFKEQLDMALVNAGVTDQPTILDSTNRQLALGLAVNWGMRFLVAYALATRPRRAHRHSKAKARGLVWLHELIQPLAA